MKRLAVLFDMEAALFFNRLKSHDRQRRKSAGCKRRSNRRRDRAERESVCACVFDIGEKVYSRQGCLALASQSQTEVVSGKSEMGSQSGEVTERNCHDGRLPINLFQPLIFTEPYII